MLRQQLLQITDLHLSLYLQKLSQRNTSYFPFAPPPPIPPLSEKYLQMAKADNISARMTMVERVNNKVFLLPTPI